LQNIVTYLQARRGATAPTTSASSFCVAITASTSGDDSLAESPTICPVEAFLTFSLAPIIKHKLFGVLGFGFWVLGLGSHEGSAILSLETLKNASQAVEEFLKGNNSHPLPPPSYYNSTGRG
jgi:hypothetical protein